MVKRTWPSSQRGATTERQPLGSRIEVAEYLGVPPSTLAFWAMKGIGPCYVKVGRCARYRWDEVDNWLAEQGHAAAKASRTG